MSAAGVTASMASNREARAGSTPSAALQQLRVQPIPTVMAKALIRRNHYLRSLPGGTKLAFGVFLINRLLGAVTLGVGPTNAHRLVDGAMREECLTLTRLWLSDELPKNRESRVLGIVLRSLKHHTDIKFLVSYAVPSQGHLGTIYQATNWAYAGLSQATPLYNIGDGKVRHSRSLSHAYGSHSVEHFASHGVEIQRIPRAAKHRYVYFLDSSWQARFKGEALPYPKPYVEPKEISHASS